MASVAAAALHAVADSQMSWRFKLLAPRNQQQQKLKKQKHSTRGSRVIPQHSTNLAQTRLTSEIGRDRVLSGWYDRATDMEGMRCFIYPLDLVPSAASAQHCLHAVAFSASPQLE